MEDLLYLALSKIKELEKRLEIYFSMTGKGGSSKQISDELDFLMNGRYYFENDIANILSGNY